MDFRKYCAAGCVVLLWLAAGFGCITPGKKSPVTSGQEAPSIAETQREAYDGPKARIAVARFKDDTGKGWWSGEMGDGMADQLLTALSNTNRYIVLDKEASGEVLAEIDLGASGHISKQTAARIGQIEGADLLVVGVVTEFEGHGSGVRDGIRGFGNKVFGKVTGRFKKAHMAIDLQVVDTRKSRIVAAASVEGEATDADLGGLIDGYRGSGALAGNLSGWKNTPTEKALRICIKEAVEFIDSKTPKSYYHYGTAVASAPPPSPGGGVMTVIVKPPRLNVRSGPGTQFAVLSSVQKGDRLKVLERSKGWIRVETDSGKEGWVSDKYTRSAK